MTRSIVFCGAALSCLVLTACAGMKPSPAREAASPPLDVYVVFFDARTAKLSQDGLDIVDHAAAAAKAQPGKMIQITGPSTHIVPGYDPSLAAPRMQAVEERLVADGVSKDRFVQTSLPDAKLMVDLTGARRVEIRLVEKPGV
jgi:outer membrane protein OmpA-like peptidoglycan-associated protein